MLWGSKNLSALDIGLGNTTQEVPTLSPPQHTGGLVEHLGAGDDGL